MRALVLKGPKTLELMEVPRPELTEDEQVLVRVEACGICGSDLRYWAGENPWALHTLGEAVPNPPNMILGHEFSGVVVEARSPGMADLVGKRVGVQAFRSCGECPLCKAGHENLCRNTVHIGHAQGWGDVAFYPGGYAEYCLAWGDLCFPMADHVSFEQEAMRDILGVAVHAVGRADLNVGDNVLCIGGGPAAFCVAQVAKAKGANRVFVSDPSPLAREVIGRLEGTMVFDPTERSTKGVLGDNLDRAEVNVIFDSVGTATTMAIGLSVLAEMGTYVNLAVHDTSVQVPALAMGSERTITSSSNALYQDEREAHELIRAGLVDVGAMITHRFALSDFEEAFSLLLSDPKQAYKIVFTSF